MIRHLLEFVKGDICGDVRFILLVVDAVDSVAPQLIVDEVSEAGVGSKMNSWQVSCLQKPGRKLQIY